MGRRRTKNKHLPPRVYADRNGTLFYWPKGSRNRIPLPEGLRSWAKIVEASEPVFTLAGLWARYDVEVLTNLAPKTQRNRRQEWGALKDAFGAVAPTDVESHHIWSYWRARGESEGAKHEIRCLSALLTYALQTGARTTPNPCFGLRLTSKTGGVRNRYVTDAEFLAVRELAPTMVGYAMDLALLTGMSQIDILSLELRQDLASGILFDRRKTGKVQLIEWNDELRMTVEVAQRETPRVRRSLICSRSGKPYTSQGFQVAWQRLMAKALDTGVLAERFTFHDLRAKNLSDATSLEEAQKRGGHADSKVTERHYRRLPMRAPALKILRKT